MENMTISYRGRKVQLRVYDYEREDYRRVARRLGAAIA